MPTKEARRTKGEKYDPNGAYECHRHCSPSDVCRATDKPRGASAYHDPRRGRTHRGRAMATTNWQGYQFAEPVCYECLPEHGPACTGWLAIDAGGRVLPCSCPERTKRLRLASRSTKQRYVQIPDGERFQWLGSASERRFGRCDWYSVASKIPSLWPFEYEAYQRAKENAAVWTAYESHVAQCALLARDCGMAEHQRPRTRPTHLWIEEWARFSAAAIAHDPKVWDERGSWELVVAERADWSYWIDRLPRIYKRIFNLLAVEKTPKAIAVELGWGEEGARVVRVATKLLNAFVKSAQRSDSTIHYHERQLQKLLPSLRAQFESVSNAVESR